MHMNKRNMLRECKFSGELLPWKFRCLISIFGPIIRWNIELVNVLQRQVQKVMLVLPSNLGLSKLRAFSRGWWRVGDLGNEICGRCFSDTVHQHTNKGRFENNSESKSESEQDTLTVQEPPALLVWGERDTAEVWLELE